MSIEYFVEGKSEIANNLLRKISDAISESLDLKSNLRIGLSFVDRDKIRSLNREYAGNDYETDVLSFSYDDFKMTAVNGDVAICTDIAREQAKDFSVSLESELVLLLIHGTLHILDYDHQTSDQTSSLDRLQSDIMKLLGFKYRNFKWQ